MGICKAKYCSNEARGNGWCSNHYYYARNHGDDKAYEHRINPKGSYGGRDNICNYKGCYKKHYSMGYCYRHYAGIRQNKGFEKEYNPTLDDHLDGRSLHPLIGRYRNMLDRCYNPNNLSYKNYGGRGIAVCDRWRESFLNFCEDLGLPTSKDHSIDRENNDGDYSPENCRWVTPDVQMNNKRMSNKLTAAKLSSLVGYSRERIRQFTYQTTSCKNSTLILATYIKEIIKMGRYKQYIYKDTAITFLLIRRSLKNHQQT